MTSVCTNEDDRALLMFRLGWRVFRRTLPGAVDPRRWRTVAIAAALGLVLVGVALASTEALFHWSGAPVGRSVAGMVLLAFAAALVAAAATPLGSGRNPLTSRPPGDWRAQERVDATLRGGPAPIRADDRHLVIERVVSTRGPLTRGVVRAACLCAGYIVALAGAISIGVVDDPLLVAPQVLIFGGGFLLYGLVSLGRGERALRLAEGMPDAEWPMPLEEPRRRRTEPRDPKPRGSKLSLPDE